MTHGVHSREDPAAMFLAPGRLASTLVMERNDVVVGDLMIRIEDAWAQAEVAADATGSQAELGWMLDPQHGGQAWPPRRSPSGSVSAPRTSGCVG